MFFLQIAILEVTAAELCVGEKSASEKFGLSLFGFGGGDENELLSEFAVIVVAVVTVPVESEDGFVDLSSGIIIIIVTVLFVFVCDPLVRLDVLCSVRLRLFPLETEDEVDEFDKYDDPFESELFTIPIGLPAVPLLSFEPV